MNKQIHSIKQLAIELTTTDRQEAARLQDCLVLLLFGGLNERWSGRRVWSKTVVFAFNKTVHFSRSAF
ncbi:hypothetical protein [Spirosoma flavum]|uniref:Transposase n=1 Tax=Spirosoma flavum TaxID=2048557 RepID=A0ABW6AK87_9BACT